MPLSKQASNPIPNTSFQYDTKCNAIPCSCLENSLFHQPASEFANPHRLSEEGAWIIITGQQKL